LTFSRRSSRAASSQGPLSMDRTATARIDTRHRIIHREAQDRLLSIEEDDAAAARRGFRRLLSALTSRVAGNPEASGVLDELSQRPGPHLQHDLPALFLDRGFRGAELAGDLLVEEAGDDSGHHVPFARGQGVVPATKLGELLPLRSGDAITVDRVSNGVEEILLAKRLRQKLDRTGFHGPNGHGDVAVTSEKDDGQRRVRFGELPLKLEAAQPREAHVEDE